MSTVRHQDQARVLVGDEQHGPRFAIANSMCDVLGIERLPDELVAAQRQRQGFAVSRR